MTDKTHDNQILIGASTSLDYVKAFCNFAKQWSTKLSKDKKWAEAALPAGTQMIVTHSAGKDDSMSYILHFGLPEDHEIGSAKQSMWAALMMGFIAGATYTSIQDKADTDRILQLSPPNLGM